MPTQIGINEDNERVGDENPLPTDVKGSALPIGASTSALQTSTSNNIVAAIVALGVILTAILAAINLQAELTETQPVSIQAPLESNGAVPINVQDQTSLPIDFYFSRIIIAPTTLLNAVTTVSPTVNVYTFDVVDSTNASIGDEVGIFQNSTDERFFFAEIISISAATGNATITVETPLDFNFNAGATTAFFDKNINIDGSVTPAIFQVEVGPNSVSSIDLNRVLFQMKTAATPTLALFGDLTSLTNGIVLRIVRDDGSMFNIWNIKDNAQLSLHTYDVAFYTALGQGQEGLGSRMTFNGQDKRGVAIRLAPGDKLQLVVQDDLTGLTEFFLMAHGHFVTDFIFVFFIYKRKLNEVFVDSQGRVFSP